MQGPKVTPKTVGSYTWRCSLYAVNMMGFTLPQESCSIDTLLKTKGFVLSHYDGTNSEFVDDCNKQVKNKGM